jgi:hypothetical protein
MLTLTIIGIVLGMLLLRALTGGEWERLLD